MSSERLNIETSYLIFGICISHRMTDYPRVGVVRLGDLILQSNVKRWQ